MHKSMISKELITTKLIQASGAQDCYTTQDVVALLSDILVKMNQFKHDETLLEPMDGDWSSYQENKFIDKLEDIVRDEIKKFQS